MVCIYCDSRTQVTNSRPQKRLNRIWRRRECLACHAIFTTEEAADLSTSLAVRRQNGTIRPFSRDKLFASVLSALGHRKTPVEDTSALTATIIAKLLHATSQAVVSPPDIAAIAYETLTHFDKAAAVQYGAYHPTTKP
jgi:transcriptional regulator NrdR family protein